MSSRFDCVFAVACCEFSVYLGHCDYSGNCSPAVVYILLFYRQKLHVYLLLYVHRLNVLKITARQHFCHKCYTGFCKKGGMEVEVALPETVLCNVV